MKGYYIWAPPEKACIGSESGVEKKIRSQVKALRNSFDVTLRIIKPREYCKTDKFISRLPFCPVSTRWQYRHDMKDIDFIYIRQVQHDASFLRFLKAVKSENPKVKIIYEIPTYPYESEGRITPKNIHVFIKDRLHRQRLKKYVDRIVTFYGQDCILGIQTLKIRNGFDFSAVHLNQKKLDLETINIIEVSTTAFWHGYDRFLSGLRDYYKNGGTRNVVFHMVGLILPEHRNFVEDNNLENHVHFYGPLSGAELNTVYEECSAGVDVLGGHRKKYPISSSLKSREYAAHGIPVITSSPVDYIDETYPYQMIVPYDDSPINIKDVITFVERCYTGTEEQTVRERIREYGYEHCEMGKVMQPIVDYIKSSEGK